MNDAELRQTLSPEEFEVLREKGTEAPFSGKYLNVFDDGLYRCRACSAVLFDSKAKYKSTELGLEGWPSFEDAIPGAVEFVPDPSYEMDRTEVICAQCKSHLGHIFDDTGSQTGKHYCINSVCLELQERSSSNGESR